MRNYFTLNGVDSRTFGVYISGQGTFNAPGRDYNLIPVPGRNGDLIGPEKRLQNGTLTYPAFIYTNFKQNIEDFRNFLLSLVGYVDLVDTYHPNEIRKVCFTGPFDADVESKNDAGKFDIQFTCKPQRYLASGQEVVTIDTADPPTETYSGETVTFETAASAPIMKLQTALEPIQDLHGYDNPWPAGGGTNIWDEEWELGSFNGSGQPSPSSTSIRCKNFIPVTPGNTYLYYNGSGKSQAPWLYDENKAFVQRYGSYMSSGGTITIPSGVYYIKFALPGTYGNTYKNDVAWNYPSTVTTYAPYSNICPISGHSGANAYVKAAYDAGATATVSVTFPADPGTVYGGTYDFVSGKLTVDKAEIASYNGETLPGAWISDRDAYAVGATPTTGAQVVYELDTPLVYDLTPQAINSLVGTNVVWSDGAVEVSVAEPFSITNPTRFDSQPLMRVYGTGQLGIGSQTVKITQADVYTDIDCEMMDAFKGTANKNPYVQLTDHNFPVFKPGVNNISLGTGITKVEITPRWWVV